MKRLLLALLLCSVALDLSAAPVRPGVFNGFWRTRFRTNEFFAVGPMTIVVPTNGRPSVYFWTPVETTNGVEYLEDSGRAMFPGRRGVLGTVRGFGHFKGRRDTYEGWTATLSGTLRHDGNRGLFSVTRFGTHFYDSPLIPEQLQILQEQGWLVRILLTNPPVALTNRAPTPEVPTNIFPPTPRPGYGFTNVIGPPILVLRTNLPSPGVVVWQLPPLTNLPPPNVLVWRPDIWPGYSNSPIVLPPVNDGGAVVIRAWFNGELIELVSPPRQWVLPGAGDYPAP